MKFLPENNKKRNWSIVILVISIAGIVYINFFAGNGFGPAPAPVDTSTDFVPGAPGDPNIDNTAVSSPQRSSKSMEIRAPGSGKLPFGASFSTGILEDDRFVELQNAPDFTVGEEELGKENLFSQ